MNTNVKIDVIQPQWRRELVLSSVNTISILMTVGEHGAAVTPVKLLINAVNALKKS